LSKIVAIATPFFLICGVYSYAVMSSNLMQQASRKWKSTNEA